MANTGSIAALLGRVATQDRSAFEGLFRTLSARLYGVALRILGNRAEADLTLQEAFTRIWLHAGGFDPARQRGLDWAIAIARDCAIERRRARPETDGPSEPACKPASGPEADYMLQEEEGRRAAGCFDVLERECAEALKATYLGGLSYGELATCCNRPLAEVRPHLRDSLGKLRACIDGADGAVADSDEDLLAAEFVLGSLDHEARLGVVRRLAAPGGDAPLAAAIEAWRGRLQPLNAAYVAVSAPDLQTTIESRLFGTPARVQQRNLKRMAMALAGGAAATFAIALITAMAVRDMAPGPDRYAATLDAQGMPLIFSAAWRPDTGELEIIRTVGLPAEPGHDYQLWLIGEDAAPISLGLLRGASNRSEVAHLPAGAKLVVSLEGSGGSASGAPSGPVLVSGAVHQL